jgi:copper chaperone CopZ
MFANNTSAYVQIKQRLLPGLFVGLAACVLGCGQQPQEPGRAQQGNSPLMETRVFAVDGMSCEGCVSTITSALKAVPGVKSVDVSLKDKKASVIAAQVSSQTIEDTINKAGYKAHLITAAQAPISGK